jgi:RimJ/RimL family protein N-acetyltransferase
VDEVALRAWTDADYPLLVALLGDPAMTRFIGGPESDEKLRSRHERYLRIDQSGTGRVFVITVGPEATPAGWVGYWESEVRGATQWEIGWSVLPAFQGRGLATRGSELAIARAAAEGRYRFIHAWPSVDNAPSNAVCRRLGMTLVASAEVEYPPGTFMLANNWRLELSGSARGHGPDPTA